MSLARASILRGPAHAVFDSNTFRSKGGIKVTNSLDTFPIDSDDFGVADERRKDPKVEVSFTPVGAWAGVASLLPDPAQNIGASIFGTDKPLLLWSSEATNNKRTFAAAAVTKPPDLILSATKSLFGPVTFTCLRADNTPWSTADKVVKIETGTYPGDADFDVADILTQPYTGVWGGSPFDAIHTNDGFKVSFNLSIKPLEVDDVGIIDYTFEKLSVSVKFKPLGVTESALIAALGIQGDSSVRGSSMSTGSHDFVISGTGVYFIAYGAALKSSPFDYAPSDPRFGECEFIATRTIAGGALNPLFYVGNSAPV